MSQVYASEPPTSGRLIFDTTHGPLEINLWCRECPQTTRFFVQLCLDGFYDDVLFHRILPNTLLQCGAMRSNQRAAVDLDQARSEWEAYRQGTQAGPALERRQYELHSRLRFSHRGLVAMALPATEENNDLSLDDLIQQQAQFFVTLEEASYLDGKHVIFGTINGPTIFNALRMGRIEVDESTGQPLDMHDAPRIKSVKIVENSIHTAIVPQPRVPWRLQSNDSKAKKDSIKKKKKRKGKLDTNVLSFGGELEEEIAIRPLKKTKSEPSKEKENDSEQKSRSRPHNDDASEEKESFKLEKESSKLEQEETSQLGEKELSQSIRSPIHGSLDGSRNQGKAAPHFLPIAAPPVPAQPSPPSSPPPPETEPTRRSRTQSAMEARRAKYAAGKKANKKYRQEETMEKLMAFQGRVKETVVASKTGHPAADQDNSLAARMARRAAQGDQPRHEEVESYHGQVLEGKGEEKLDYQRSSNWMATTFKCRRHIDHSAGSDGRRAEDYEVLEGSGDGDKDRDDDDRRRDRRYRKHHGHHYHHHDEQSKKSQDRHRD